MKIISFGVTKDITGSMLMDFDTGTEKLTIADFKEKLFKKYPDLEKLKSLSFAINNTYATNDMVVFDQDEIALIPPVSGG